MVDEIKRMVEEAQGQFQKLKDRLDGGANASLVRLALNHTIVPLNVALEMLEELENGDRPACGKG